jgi:hypothetical protein
VLHLRHSLLKFPEDPSCCVLCCIQASAFVLFPDLKSACDAVLPLKQHKVAVAVELHDYASLRCVRSPALRWN